LIFCYFIYEYFEALSAFVSEKTLLSQVISILAVFLLLWSYLFMHKCLVFSFFSYLLLWTK